MTGVVVFAHGSPIEVANEPVRALAREICGRGDCTQAVAAFLDCADPDLSEAVRRLVESGIKQVVVVPFFLTTGLHLQRDLPRLVDGLRNTYTELDIAVAAPLEGHPALLGAVLDRVKEIIDGGSSSGSQAG